MRVFLKSLPKLGAMGPVYDLINIAGETVTNVAVLNVTPDLSSLGLAEERVLVTLSMPRGDIAEVDHVPG